MRSPTTIAVIILGLAIFGIFPAVWAMTMPHSFWEFRDNHCTHTVSANSMYRRPIGQYALSRTVNELFKYADDTTLLVPEHTDFSLQDEFMALKRWSKSNTVGTVNKLFKYADDTTLLVPEHTDFSLEDEFMAIKRWSESNKMIFNLLKTKRNSFSPT